MGHSLYFLTATWLAAQAIEPQAAMPGAANPAACSRCQNGAWGGNMQHQGSWRPFAGNCQDRSGFFQRIGDRFRGWFGRGHDDDYQGNCQHNMANSRSPAVPGDLHLNLPSTVKVTEPPLADVVQKPAAPRSLASSVDPIHFKPVSGAKSGVSPRMAEKVGHENDFSWITGQLRRDNGRWLIHFATPEIVDRYNGRLVLSSGLDMSKFVDGDLVTVHGHILSARGSLTATYNATSVDLIEHDTK